MKKVKITVVKRLSTKEIYGEIPTNVASKLGCSAKLSPTCQVYAEGQEFIWPSGGNCAPEGFRCSGAWDVIYPHLLVLAFGGEFDWMNEKDKYLIACPDGFRPVIFRLERLEEKA